MVIYLTSQRKKEIPVVFHFKQQKIFIPVETSFVCRHPGVIVQSIRGNSGDQVTIKPL